MQQCLCCNEVSCYDTFKCMKCHKLSHWKCYNFDALNKQPSQMRCLQCQLNSYDPFHQVISFAKLSNGRKAFWLKEGQTFNRKWLNFELNSTQTEKIKTNKLKLVCICTSINDDKKLYGWPTDNLYIELGQRNYHIKYTINEYAIIPPHFLDSQEQFVRISLTEPIEQAAVFAIAIIQEQSFKSIQSQISEIKQEEQLQNAISSLNKKYIEKLRQIQNQNNEELQQQEYFHIKLTDGLTLQQLEIPVRGTQCLHFECFDLLSYLNLNKAPSKQRWKCPLCNLLVPIDVLMIDYVQLKILHSIKKRYPSFCHLIVRVSIINTYLEYKLIDDTVEQKQIRQSELFEKSKIIQDKVKLRYPEILDKIKQYPQLTRLMEEYIKKEAGNTWISIKSAQNIVKTIITKNVLKSVENNNQQIIEFFVNLYDFTSYLQWAFTDEIEIMQELCCFELIAKKLKQQSLSGLFVYYIQLFKKQIQEVCKSFLILTLEDNFKFEKLLELIIAYSYQKDSGESPGYHMKELLECLFKKYPDRLKKILVQIANLLPKIFYKNDIPNYFLVKNCYFIADLFENHVSLLPIIYPQELLNKQTSLRMNVTLIMYLRNAKYNIKHKNNINQGFVQFLQHTFCNINFRKEMKIVENIEGIETYIYL